MQVTGGIFDLHTHSTASDGLLPPSAVVRRAKPILSGISLTDHDSLDGVAEALAAGREEGMPVIPGVEFTTDQGQHEVHILAYFVDHLEPQLTSRLAEVVQRRVVRAQEIVDRLVRLGFRVSWEEVKRQAPGVYIGRPHIVRALVAQGLVRREAVDRFFQTYLVSGAPAYVPHEELSTAEAIALACAAGGVPVLAHPGLVGTDDILPGLVLAGIGGVEVNHPRHGPADVARYRRFAAKYGLIATGGSDYHGEPNGTRLGEASTGLETVAALAQRARGPIGRSFLSALHIPNATRE